MNFLPEEIDEILNIFRDESSEIIDKFNNSLLRLEENPEEEKNLLSLFQEAHSLKGAARMIGFYNIQNLAHKIEDILSLIKSKKIGVSKDIVSTLYKVSDFLLVQIEQSVKNKNDIKHEDFDSHINSLLEIINNSSENVSNKESSLKVETSPIGEDYFLSQVQNISALILESNFVLERYNEEEKEAHVSILIDNFKNLSDILQKTPYEEICSRLEPLMSSFKAASQNILRITPQKITEFRKDINEITADINRIFERLSIPKIFLEEQPETFEKEETINKDQNQEDEDSKKKHLKQKLEYLSSIISQIKFDPSYIENAQNQIIGIINLDVNPNITKIYKKTFDILDQIKKNEIKPENEIISIITQSFNFTKDLILNNESNENAENEDLTLLFQRLSIIEQMIDITETKKTTKITEQKDTEAVQPEFQKVQDFFKTFEIGAIKTLRVDTKKLDALISQMGELIINGIKTKKHLSELDKINQNLSDWNLSLKKTVNYIKYCDKKNINPVETSENINIFNKHLFSMFQGNQSGLNSVIKDINNLYKQINEDDIKLNHIILEIENIVKSIRVLPLATIFHMFPRMIRDIASNNNKDVELLISGSETAVDKKILEEIKMPLIHILRNSIDHGIESPEDRIKKGKSPTGRIHLSAKYEENKILITVEDDGLGINIKKIKEKALSKGLLTPEEISSMSDEQIMNLIFWPGFSTGDQITEISGRGIGLDIVQTKISQLNGKVKIYSLMDKGAKVVIELPISMSTVKSFVVSIAEQKFAIPMSAVKIVQWLNKDKIITKDGYKSILLENQTIPIIDLGKMLNLKTNKEESNNITVIVLETANSKVAYIVDRLLGDQEILQKKLSPPVFKLKFISGITTLADGDLCLILNVSELIKNTVNNLENIITAEETKLIENQKNQVNPNNFKIMVIDDSITTLTLLKRILSNSGFQVEAISNPDLAINKLKQEKYDLIITDIDMPNINGKELLEEIKCNEDLAQIPVLVISTLPQQKLNEELKELNIKNYTNKQSFEKNKFILQILEILKK